MQTLLPFVLTFIWDYDNKASTRTPPDTEDKATEIEGQACVYERTFEIEGLKRPVWFYILHLNKQCLFRLSTVVFG